MSADPNMENPVLRLSQLRFGYSASEPVLDLETLHVAAGESVFLRGPSGSGKSTLLSLVGGILRPWSGEIEVCGAHLSDLSPAQRDRVRADHLGIIFQQLNLLPYLDVIGNVTLACRFSKRRKAQAIATDGSVRAAALRLLSELGLPDSHLARPVSALSVGQQQRVAVARSLIGSPDLVIADEPTSALDTANRDRFIELLDRQRRQTGCALLFVSHDESLSSHFDRAVDLSRLNKRSQSLSA
jgi:putative ABC transport system ATP-binding protein